MKLTKPAAILLLILAATVAYWNSFDVPFVFDDMVSVQRNYGVRTGYFNWNPLDGRWVLYLTFTLNSMLSGQDVWGYHLINLLLHILNGIAVFLIAEHLLGGVNPAALAAAVFLLHPVQTESVVYVSSRSELLSTAFYLAGFLLFLKSRAPGILLALGVGICLFLGIGSKETAITLPAVILAYDWIFNGKPWQRWRFYLPFVIAVPLGIYHIFTMIRPSLGGTAWHYFLTQTRVLVQYLGIIAWPAHLNLEHDVAPSTEFDSAVLGSLALLSLILLGGWLARRPFPILTFSVFWFFITLAPTSSFFPIADLMFEHRLYLPMAGVVLSVPLLMDAVSAGFERLRTNYAYLWSS